MNGMSQQKNPELDAKHQAILRRMMQMPENKSCADCGGPSPRWASTNLGIFVCISCSGIHRKLGTHVSQVRSVTLDTWTPAQIAHFTKFGNARAAQYFEACIPPGSRRPQQGDSMQMERFIRDKYENKRYITVENGGLGGGSSEHTSYCKSTGSSFGGGLGTRPTQFSQKHNSRGYDQAQSGQKFGKASMSYAGRFGSGHGSNYSSSANSSPAPTRRTGIITGQTPHPQNAIQRASTMKELINMGFSAQVASRAVEAAEGDLQKAVDWVLEHNRDAKPSNAYAGRRAQIQAPERDLLDFGDPEPTQLVAQKPESLDSEVLVSTRTANKTSKATDHSADFADFGDFESALPSANPLASEMATRSGTGNLGTTIRSVYKQSISQPAQPFLKGVPQVSRLDQTAGSPQAHPIRTKPSPKLLAQKAAEASIKVPAADLGLTSFTGLAKSHNQLSSFTANEQHSPSPIFKSLKSISASKSEHVPPPPPPLMETFALGSEQDPQPPPPPPPESPPPIGKISTTLGKSPKSAPPLQQAGDDQSQEACDREKEDASRCTESPEEPEDPFAALSFMAMRSAKSNTKKMNQRRSAQNIGDGLLDLGNVSESSRGNDQQNSATAVTSATPGGIDLDELLG